MRTLKVTPRLPRPFRPLLAALASVAALSPAPRAWTLDSVQAPAADLKAIMSGDPVVDSGTIRYKVSNPAGDSLYSAITLVPASDTTMEGLIPFWLEGQAGVLGKADGWQTARFKCALPGLLKADGAYRARVTVSDSMVQPPGNIRRRGSRIFYLGNSITQAGDFARMAESTLAKAVGGTLPVFSPPTGVNSAQKTPSDPAGAPHPIRQFTGAWTVGPDTMRIMSWGWSGATTGDMVTMPLGIGVLGQFKADLVLVELGVNDAAPLQYDSGHPLAKADSLAAAYKDNLGKLADLIRLAGAQPLFLSPPAANEAKTFQGHNLAGFNQLLARLVRAEREEAAAKDVRFVSDFDEYLKAQATDSTLPSADGIHPPAAGHLFMAARIAQELGSSLPLRRP